LQFSSSRPSPARHKAGLSCKSTLADLNARWPADPNATSWVLTQDGSWTRMVGAGVNPDIPRPAKKGPPERAAEGVSE
jgi:hypothetical protein